MNALRKDELKNYLPESLRSQLTSEHCESIKFIINRNNNNNNNN